eukprot:1019872-Pyramimonas_sp.AAC.1
MDALTGSGRLASRTRPCPDASHPAGGQTQVGETRVPRAAPPWPSRGLRGPPARPSKPGSR